MITPISRPIKPALPEIQYIPFVSVTEYGNHGGRVKESHYKKYGHYCQVVMVSRSDIEGFNKTGFRMFGIMPGTLGRPWTGDPEARRKDLRKFAGYPQFNFGMYYDLDYLLFMDDVIEYNHHQRKFEDIRSARDFVKQHKHI